MLGLSKVDGPKPVRRENGRPANSWNSVSHLCTVGLQDRSASLTAHYDFLDRPHFSNDRSFL